MGSTNDSIWFFEEVDLYKTFCIHDVRAYNRDKAHTFLKISKGQFIYFEEDRSEKVFLISDGKVKIGTYLDDGRELTKAVLSRGEIFGEMAIMGEDERKDFAHALTDVTLCPLTLEEMEDLMKDNKPLALSIRKLIGFRLRKAERLIASLLFKSSRDRVVEYLIDVAKERGRKVGFEIVVEDFHNHTIIGSLTATSRQTVSTVLNELKRKNLLTFTRKRLLIRDMDKLSAELGQG